MRVVNRLLALALGAGLLVVGLVAVGEALLAYLGRDPVVPHDRWAGALQGRAWSDPLVVQVLAVAALVGLLLAAVQLVPQRPTALALSDARDDRRTQVDRRGLQERLRRVAVADHDVLSARTRVRRRRARVTLWAPPDADAKAVRARVRHALRADVQALGMRHRLRPAVRVRQARERVR